jgi:proton-translocating NADH-quinone oxidoreductase chain N
MDTFIWLLILLTVGGPLVYLSGRLRPLQPWGAARTALLLLAVSWAIFLLAWRDFTLFGPALFSYGTIEMQWDGVSLLLTFIVMLLGSLVALYSRPYVAGQPGEEKYFAALMILLGSMVGLGCSGDLFNLWVWFETMAVASYLLVAFQREQAATLEASVKYLIQSAAGSALVLIGIALVLMETGTLNMAEIQAVGSVSPLLLAAGGLFIIGYGVKAALVPLHTWLPDAHAQAPSGISAMLSGVVIQAGLIALLRSLLPLTAVTLSWGPLLLLFGAVNMLTGNLMALRQTQVKRLLAYSSLSHTGYILLGIGAAVMSGEWAAAQGSFFHIISHALLKGLAFLAAGALLYALAKADDHRPLVISDIGGAAQRYPLAALALSLALLGLGGLPPLVGFMSKWQILAAGATTQNLLIMGLILFAAVNSVLSLGYYAPLVNRMYRHQPAAGVLTGKALPIGMTIPLLILTLAVLLLGFWPTLVEPITEVAALFVR